MYVYMSRKYEANLDGEEEDGRAKYVIYLPINTLMKLNTTYNVYVMFKYLRMDVSGESR